MLAGQRFRFRRVESCRAERADGSAPANDAVPIPFASNAEQIVRTSCAAIRFLLSRKS